MLRNSEINWGLLARALHWIGALMILILLLHGWWMTHMTPRPDRLANYAWHSALGFDLLALTVLRILWRWVNPVPALPGDLKPWERWLAHIGHFGLYVLIIAVSLAGWVTANTFRTPITQDLLGIAFPTIASGVERSVRRLFEESHMILSYVLAAIVIGHVVAALRHHFVKKNDVLRRMTCGARASAGTGPSNG